MDETVVSKSNDVPASTRYGDDLYTLSTKIHGLSSELEEALAEGSADGRSRTLIETSLPYDVLPAGYPFSFEELMTLEFVYQGEQPG